MCFGARDAFGQASAQLELVGLFASADSIRFTARMENNGTGSFVMEAVFVTVTYDPAVLDNDSLRCIKNHRFASAGFDSYSNALFRTRNPNDEDTVQYGEASPTIGNGVTIPKNAPLDLCTFTFFPKFAPGCTGFYIVGNVVTPAYTGFYITSQAQSIPFFPATNLPNYCYPVEFVSFTAMQQGASIALRWVTASELNNYGFTIERRYLENNTADWEDIGFVQGKGNSNTDVSYLFFDTELPGPGKYEYRLRQQDFDGSINRTPVRQVEYILGARAFGLDPAYPNPVSSSSAQGTVLRFSLTEQSETRLVVMNTLGQVVAELTKMNYPAGTYSQSWFPRNLPPGMYVATLTAQGAETGRTRTATTRLQVVQ
jgi:hypothetical protein